MVLQLAHPLVAAGVSEHSVYAADLWKRLLGALRAPWLVSGCSGGLQEPRIRLGPCVTSLPLGRDQGEGCVRF